MITRVLAVTDDAAPFTSNRTLTGTLSQLFPAGRRGRREVCRIPPPGYLLIPCSYSTIVPL